MPHAIADVELGEPLPTIKLSANEAGLALLLRMADRPIGFFIEELRPGTALLPHELGHLISRRARLDIVRANLHEELHGPFPRASAVDLTVAVCTRDRASLLRDCLESVLADRNGRGRFRVLVVDNAPSDSQTRDLVTLLPDVEYTLEPKPGLDFARNRALSEAKTEFLAFIDDDVVVDRGWLAGLEEALGAHPDLGGVTGQVLPYELATDSQVMFEQHCSFRRGFQQVRYAGQVREGNSLYPTGPGMFGAGCNMVFRCDVLRQLGGFDEALDTGPPLPGGGDLDIFYRLIRAGYPLIYEPRLLVFHRHRRERHKLRRQYWSWGTGFMAFWHKTYRFDVDLRPRLRRMMAWWLRNQLGDLRKSLRSESRMPADMALAQLAGGLLTVGWKYPWSCRRTERIKKRSP